MGAVLKMNFLYLKNRWFIFLLMFGLSLGFTGIFGISFSQVYRPTVFYYNASESPVAAAIIDQLKRDDQFTVVEKSSERDLARDLTDGKGIAGVILDSALTTDSISEHVLVMKASDSVEYGMFYAAFNTMVSYGVNDVRLPEQILAYEQALYGQNIIETHRVVDFLQEQYVNHPAFLVETVTLGEKRDYNPLTQNLIGFSVMLSMYTVVFGIGKIVEEKQEHVWQRQLVSPLSTFSILSGNAIGTVILGLIQITLMFYGGKYLFGVDFDANPMLVVVVLTAFIFAVMALGLFLSSFVNTMQQLGALAPVIITATSMLGGTMWPIEMVNNPWVRRIADLMPQRWAMSGMTKLVVDGGTMGDILLPVGVLVLMGILYMGAGTWILKRKAA